MSHDRPFLLANIGDDLAYETAGGGTTSLDFGISVYGDQAYLRDQICQDACDAGFRILATGGLDALLETDRHPFSDVIVADCPVANSMTLSGLARLNAHVRHIGAQLLISTSLEALDDVFDVLDLPGPQILVAPSRAERMIALGQAMGQSSLGRVVQEVAEQDRVLLLRLTEQISQLANRIGTTDFPTTTPSPPGLQSSGLQNPALQNKADMLLTAHTLGDAIALQHSVPSLPDAQIVRRIIQQRQMRARFIDEKLFADPAWDMLLDLTAAHVEQTRVSVTSLCIASGVALTTALRWISQMTEAGLLERTGDEIDRRRIFVSLTDKALDAMAHYFAELGGGLVYPI